MRTSFFLVILSVRRESKDPFSPGGCGSFGSLRSLRMTVRSTGRSGKDRRGRRSLHCVSYIIYLVSCISSGRSGGGEPPALQCAFKTCQISTFNCQLSTLNPFPAVGILYLVGAEWADVVIDPYSGWFEIWGVGRRSHGKNLEKLQK